MEKKLGENVCTIEELKKYITLNTKEEENLKKVIGIHPMYITKYYMSLIDKDDMQDPIRKLIVPSEDELDISGSYDTSGEHGNNQPL